MSYKIFCPNGGYFYYDNYGVIYKKLIVNDVYKLYFEYGVRHRLDGPAVEGLDENHKNEWFYRGQYIELCLSQEDFERWLKLKAFW